MSMLTSAVLDLTRAKTAMVKRLYALLRVDLPTSSPAATSPCEADGDKWTRLEQTEARVQAFVKEVNAGLPSGLHRKS